MFIFIEVSNFSPSLQVVLPVVLCCWATSSVCLVPVFLVQIDSIHMKYKAPPNNFNKMIISSNTSLAAPGALAHHLQHRTACQTAQPVTPHRLSRRTTCNAAPPATPHRRTTCNAAPPAMPHCLPCRIVCKMSSILVSILVQY